MAFYSRAKVIIFFQLFEKSEKYFSILHSSLFTLHSSLFTFFFFFLHISKLNRNFAAETQIIITKNGQPLFNAKFCY